MAGITQAMTNSFKSDILSAGHNFNTTNRAVTTNTQDSFRIGLYSASTATIDATTTAYTNTGEITGTGYTNTGVQSTSGLALTISAVPTLSGTSVSGGTSYINFTNVSWTSASFSADGALIWNSTNAGKSVAVLNFGGTKTVTSGTFQITFPTPTPAILQIS
jgi:hypothetical protein